MTKFTRRDWLRTASAAALLPASLQTRLAFAAPPTPADVKSLVDPAIKFLATKQNEDGSLFPKGGGPGITALAVAAAVRNGYGPDNPFVAKGLKYLEGNIK